MFWSKKNTKEDKQQTLQQNFLNEFKTMLTNSGALDDSWRNRLGNMMSGGYDFSDVLHQIFEDFGYPETLAFANFWNMYRRFGPAQAICDIPVDFTWLDLPTVDGGDKFNTDFEKLVKKTRLWKRIKGADNRQRVGRYSGLFIRVRDNKKTDEPMETLSSIDNIVSFTPLYESQLKVSKTEQDPSSLNFGNPTMYDFQGSVAGNRNEEQLSSFQIHESRIIPFAEGADDGSIYGKSAIESSFNDLMDLRKISGAFSEGSYQNTRNTPVITAKEDYESPKGQDKIDFEDEYNEFLNKWRKVFVTEGLEFNYPDISQDDPESAYNNSMKNISAGAKIPSKLIVGNQEGNLASTEDGKHFLLSMMSRRENYGTESIENVIDWLVKYNVLTEPADLTIEWDDLLAQSDKDKAAISKERALAFNNLATGLSQPAVDGAVTLKDLMTLIFGEEAIEDFVFSDPINDGLTDDELDDADLDNTPEPE